MTSEIWILAALLFLPIVVISFLALRRAWEPQEPVLERQPPPGAELSVGPSSELVFEYLTYPFAVLIPTTKAMRLTLCDELRAAGYYRISALTDYLALRNLLVLLSVVVAGMLALILEPEDIPIIALAGVVSALVAYSLPRLVIQAQGRSRARQIERELPIAVDLLTLALTAGMNLYAAIGRVARELRYSCPVLAEEFDITRRQAELSSLEHALRQLADRVRLPEVRNLALILAQSERLGSDATTVLLETSNNLRTSLRQRAEAQANRTSFWLLFPTIGCFLIAAFLLIVGPVMLDVSRQLNENLNLLQRGQRDIKRVMGFNKPPRLPVVIPNQ